MKKIIWLVVVLVLAALVYSIWMSKPEEGVEMEEVTQTEVAEAETIEGSVVSINTDGVALDGPALVTVSTESGERVVAVPSMGINLCAAREQIADVYTLEVGEKVSVRGELDEEGRIVPCVDAAHYLRVE